MVTNYSRRLYHERRSFYSRINRLLDKRVSVDHFVGTVLIACAITGSLVAWLL